MPEKLFWWLVAIIVIVKMILVGWWPFLIHTDVARDATLSLEQAMSLLDGKWLGQYTDLTLARGPVAPMWIALMHYVGVPLMLSQSVLYVCACVIAMLAFARFTDSKGGQLCVFAVLLFNPYSHGYALVASSVREGLDQSLVIGIFGLSITLFADLIRRDRVSRARCFLLGVFFLLFWYNGEARVWILPCLGWLVLAALVHAWRQNRIGGFDTVSGLLSIVLIPGGVWVAGTLAIAYKNAEEYDVFAVTESDTRQFGRALNGLLSVDAGQRVSGALVPPKVIEEILSVPAAGGLTAGPGEFWIRNPVSPVTLRLWLRSAVSRAGYYKQGGKAVLAYYDELGQGIETACADAAIDCGVTRWRAMSPAGEGGWTALPSAVGDVILEVLEIPVSYSIADSYSTGSSVSRLGVSRLVNSPIRTKESLEKFLPDFFKRTAKNKTRYLNKLVTAYRTVAPILFWVAALGLVLRMVFLRGSGAWTLIDNIYIGLAGTILLQLVTLAATRAAGGAESTSSLAWFYPVFYLFILTGLLSITRDIRKIVTTR